MNELLDKLRASLPFDNRDNKKLTKLVILQAAGDYSQKLQNLAMNLLKWVVNLQHFIHCIVHKIFSFIAILTNNFRENKKLKEELSQHRGSSDMDSFLPYRTETQSDASKKRKISSSKTHPSLTKHLWDGGRAIIVIIFTIKYLH